ncbi:MAG: hypothetical protein C4536_09960 [Actinobacteria bacterium]|jgi:hypothetical protein|nr:MAG: hypothetical protein C4536_09960 [Actinomycetota bacterium]
MASGRRRGAGLEKEGGKARGETGPARRSLYWYLMVVGLVLIAYFTLNLIINVVYAVDASSQGVLVVLEEPLYENGSLAREAVTTTLHGASGWAAAFAPWLALNAYLLALGVIFFAIGYMQTPVEEERLPVSLFKLRLLGGYLLALAAVMVILGFDRIFFLPHEAKTGSLAWIDWYLFEFLAHVVWAAVIALLAVFLLRVQRSSGIGGDAKPSQ